MARPVPASVARPPEKGSFPLDHLSECRYTIENYYKCMGQNSFLAPKCREEARAYLQCRMDKDLMMPESTQKWLPSTEFVDLRHLKEKEREECSEDITPLMMAVRLRTKPDGFEMERNAETGEQKGSPQDVNMLLWLVLLTTADVPVCPHSRFNETVISYAPSGAPCNERKRCQNAFLPGALGRHCWRHPDDPRGATYCLQQRTQQRGDPCWLFPEPNNSTLPADGQCAEGLYCWVANSISVEGNSTVTDTTGRGYCLPQLDNGLPCTYHSDCKTWCKELAPGIKACAPRHPTGSACVTDEGCESNTCFERTCIVVSKEGELCDRYSRCGYSLDCINSRCGYHAAGIRCNPFIPPYGGCAAHHYCDGNMTKPICKPIEAQCNMYFNSCEPGYGCDAGTCTPLNSKKIGAVTSHVRFCEKNLFLDTSTAVHFCASTKGCTLDSECALDAPPQHAYCRCDAVSDAGKCVLAIGSNKCTDMTTPECCSIASIPSNCEVLFQHGTGIFGGRLLTTVEASPLWCNERCVVTPQCAVWSYRSTTKDCTLGEAPYTFVKSTETVDDISSEVLRRCTADTSAYDYTVPGMKQYCPINAKHDLRVLIDEPSVPAYHALPYMLRRYYDAEPVVWFSPDLDMGGARWLSSLESDVLWVPEGVLVGGRTYTFGLLTKDNATKVAAVDLYVVEAPVVTVTTNDTHIRFCNILQGMQYRVYTGGVLVISSNICVYTRGGDKVVLCVSDGVSPESCGDAYITLPAYEADYNSITLVALGRRYLEQGVANISGDLLLLSAHVNDTSVVPHVASDDVTQLVNFLNVLDVSDDVTLQALQLLLVRMTTRMTQAVGSVVLNIANEAGSVRSATVLSLLRLALLRDSSDRYPTKLYANQSTLYVHRSNTPGADPYVTDHVPSVHLDFDLLLPIDVLVFASADGVVVHLFEAGGTVQYPLPDSGYPVSFSYLPLPSPIPNPTMVTTGIVMLLTRDSNTSISDALDEVALASGVNRTQLHVVDTKGIQVLLYSEDPDIAVGNMTDVTVRTDPYQDRYPCPWPLRVVVQDIMCMRNHTQLGCETQVKNLISVQTGEKRTEYVCNCKDLSEYPVHLEYMPTLRHREGGVEHFLSQKRVHTTVFPVPIALLLLAAAAVGFGAAVHWETKLEGKTKDQYWMKDLWKSSVPAKQRARSERGLSQIGFDLWSLNNKVVMAAESDATAWSGTQKVWWLMTLGAAHAWLYIGSSRIAFRPHQRVLVIFLVVSYVTFIASTAVMTCDDYHSTGGIFEAHVWFISRLSIPGSCVFTLLCVLFSASPLSIVSKKMYETTPAERIHEATGTVQDGIESVRTDLRLRPEELSRIAHHEVLGRRLHCAVSVAVLADLRDNGGNKLLDLNEVDFDAAFKTCKQSWLTFKDSFVNWYTREEENVLWVAGLKALAAHDFQLAAALFHLSLLSDNPDLYVVFNDRVPPDTTRGIIDSVVQKNVIGRLWVDYYATTLLKMSKEQIYKCLLQSSFDTEELVVLLGVTHDDSVFDGQGDRAPRMCNGEVWSWQDGIRALRDDPRGPQVVTASQVFCWAPQELCSYTMLNSTVIIGPVDVTTQTFERGEGEAPFKPRHLVYGRLMTRYYCCVLSQLPGQAPTAEQLTPQEWVQWTLEEESKHLTPSQPPTLPPEQMPFRLNPPKKRHIPNVYLTFLLNWKLAPTDQEVGTFCVASPLEPLADAFGPITRINDMWKEQETGSRHHPFVGVEKCLKHLRENNKVYLQGGVYPSLKLSRLQGSYHFPITFYGDGDVVFLSRDLGRRCVVWLDECSFIQWSGVVFNNAVYGVDASSSYCISFTKCVFRKVHKPVNQTSDDIRNMCFDETNRSVDTIPGPLPTFLQMTFQLAMLVYVVTVVLAAAFFAVTLYYCLSMSERMGVAWLLLSLFAIVQDLFVNQPVIVAVYLVGRKIFSMLTKKRGTKVSHVMASIVAANRLKAGQFRTLPDIMPQVQAEEDAVEALGYSESGSFEEAEPRDDLPEFVRSPQARSLLEDEPDQQLLIPHLEDDRSLVTEASPASDGLHHLSD